jgi:hypothetical protein
MLILDGHACVITLASPSLLLLEQQAMCTAVDVVAIFLECACEGTVPYFSVSSNPNINILVLPQEDQTHLFCHMSKYEDVLHRQGKNLESTTSNRSIHVTVNGYSQREQ